MRLGIIGAGHVGQALARLAVRTGHQATLSNTRGPDTLARIVDAVGCTAATVPQVVDASEMVVLAIPLAAVFTMQPAMLARRIVIDTTNYYPERDGRIAALDRRETTTSQLVADHFSEAMIVKAFNAILASDLVEPVPMAGGVRRALPIAGENADAKGQVTMLHAAFGYDAVDTGPLAQSWRFERAKPAYCLPFDRDGLTAALAAAERDRDLPEGSWRRR